MNAAVVRVVAGILCTTVAARSEQFLLTLERAEMPGCPWEEIAADSLSVLDGGFMDPIAAPSAVYRMRITELGPEDSPGPVPIDDVPLEIRLVAERLVEDVQLAELAGSWTDAVPGSWVWYMYDPCETGPSYAEFKVELADPRPTPHGSWPAAKDRGYILVSLTENDFPIVEFSTTGPALSESLHRAAGTAAVWIYRYGDGFIAAEDRSGHLRAYLGSYPARYPDNVISNTIGQVFEGFVDASGETEPPGQPEFVGEPYDSYEEFKADYVASGLVEAARQQRRLEAELEWDIIRGTLNENLVHVTLGEPAIVFGSRRVTECTLGDPDLASLEILSSGLRITGLETGSTKLQVDFESGEFFRGTLRVSEDGPEDRSRSPAAWTDYTTYLAGTSQNQRLYRQFMTDGYAVGCGPTAWALLYGWFDAQWLAPELIGDMEFVAPLHNTPEVRQCMSHVRDATDTYRVGLTDQSATNPWRMDDGMDWAADKLAGRDFSDAWSVPGFPKKKCRRKASDAIQDGRPAIIGIGRHLCVAHYCVAYGYRYRDLVGIWGNVLYRERWFLCNLGNGTPNFVWKHAGQVWYGADADFWHIP